MFRRVKSLVRNHWQKIVFGGIAIQATAYGLKYATNRLIAFQEEQTRSVWKKMKKQQHFESTEQILATTYSSLLQTLKETLNRSLDSELLMNSLKNKVSNKLEAWEELKIVAFSRILTIIYGTSLLYICLRIQLSVISGYLFQDHNSDGEKENITTTVDGAILSNDTMIDSELQKKYLSLANYLCSTGVEKLCQYIYEKTRLVVEKMSLKQKLTPSELEQVLWSIIKKETPSTNASEISKNPIKSAWKYVFPEEVIENEEIFAQQFERSSGPPDMYKRLIVETFDLLASDDVSGVLKFFQSHGVSHFVDRIGEAMLLSSQAKETSDTPHSTVDFDEISLPLAKIIPLVNSLSLNSSAMTDEDPWIVVLTTSDSVRTLGANIYESFSSE